MPQRRRKPQTGGRFNPIPFIKKVKNVADTIGKVNNYLKKTKAISKIGSIIPNAQAQKIAGKAGSLGYGRRRKPQTGGFLGKLLLLSRMMK